MYVCTNGTLFNFNHPVCLLLLLSTLIYTIWSTCRTANIYSATLRPLHICSTGYISMECLNAPPPITAPLSMPGRTADWSPHQEHRRRRPVPAIRAQLGHGQAFPESSSLAMCSQPSERVARNSLKVHGERAAGCVCATVVPVAEICCVAGLLNVLSTDSRYVILYLVAALVYKSTHA